MGKYSPLEAEPVSSTTSSRRVLRVGPTGQLRSVAGLPPNALTVRLLLYGNFLNAFP